MTDMTTLVAGKIADAELKAATAALRRAESDQDALWVQTHALVSIAASLRAQQPVTFEAELAGCACNAQPAGPSRAEVLDLLEFGFGVACNAEHSISSGGKSKTEWDEAFGRFRDTYHGLLDRIYGPAATAESAAK